jgi:hypothetical protein
MGKNRIIERSLAAALALLAALLAAPGARAQGGPTLRNEEPGFRTDLGVHGSFGGTSCLPGGSGYAACDDPGRGWNTRFGFQLGALLRPYEHFSFGVDGGLATLTSRAVTANQWWDVTVGPVARVHFPVRVGKKLYFEPSLGLQAGFVYGVYRQNQALDGSGDATDFRHKHYGPFVSAILGLDVFPVPRVGVGLDVRVLRTFYTTVCFENAGDSICRGTHQDDLATSDASGTPYLGDLKTTTFPWKLFWGVHALYYF